MMEPHPVRFEPETELKSALIDFVTAKKLSSPFILTCVGSVKKATLRFAEKTDDKMRKFEEIRTFNEPFEICSLTGTLTSNGNGCHLHVTLGRGDGSSVSGHVVGDMIVFTTAEVVVGNCPGHRFSRERDERTGFPELVIKQV